MGYSGIAWPRWLTFATAVSVLIAVTLASLIVPVDIDSFTSDVVQLGGVNRFAGVVSQLGLFGWCASASVCIFTAFVLKERAPREHVLFMSFSSMLSAWLLLDDAFLLHEWNEVLAFSLLGMAVPAYLWRFAPLIRTTPYVYLLVALSGLGLSLTIDEVRERFFDFDFLNQYINWGSWEHLCEDGPKWIGIVYWCSYFCQTAWLLIKRGGHGSGAGSHPGDPGVPGPPIHQGHGS